MNKIIWLLIVFIAGSFLPIQAGLNNKMGKAIDNPVYASMISFVVGAISLCIYVLLTKQTVSWIGLKSAPLYVWLAGVLGAFYVTAIIFAFPRIGPALTFGLVVAGQMVISILLDHFKILVAQQHPINIWRIVGVLLIVGGVVIIRKF
jgi:transporter family-2 protein